MGLRNWRSFIGPGIVMCGIALAGGEWLVGPDITARYGGGLMWICSIAILAQVFYNIEVGRYALATGEPILTAFMRAWPGPTAWICLILVLSIGSFIPAMSTNAASIVVAAWLGRPPLVADAWLVKLTAYVLLGVVTLPILAGGKVYNTLQVIFTVKVVAVLGLAATSRDVIQAYRGTDEKNSLASPVPSDATATGTFQLPAGMTTDSAQNSIGQIFSTIAIANPGNRILVRLDARNLVTYWMEQL